MEFKIFIECIKIQIRNYENDKHVYLNNIYFYQ